MLDIGLGIDHDISGYENIRMRGLILGMAPDEIAGKMQDISSPLTSGIEGDWSREGAPKDNQDEAQELPEPGEDTAEVVANG